MVEARAAALEGRWLVQENVEREGRTIRVAFELRLLTVDEARVLDEEAVDELKMLGQHGRWQVVLRERQEHIPEERRADEHLHFRHR